MAGCDQISAVRAALDRDPDINLHRFPIDVSHNGALCLEGTVEDIVALRKALRLAREVSDNGRVVDHLHIQRGLERDGDALCQAVIEALSSETAFRDVSVADAEHGAPGNESGGDWIVVSVSGSGVHLEGKLRGLVRRRLAEVITWWVPGTSRVENRIHVIPPEQDSDLEITEAVRMVLEMDPSLDAGQINVFTRDQRVTLTGSVNSDINRKIATLDCWYVPGVHGVDNQLRTTR